MRNLSSYLSTYYREFPQTNHDVVLPLKLQHTKWLFFGLCCYLLSQGFTIPILAIGPSWAMWPTLPNLATALFIISFLLSSRNTLTLSKASKNIFYILVFIFLGCILSFAWHLTWVSNENAKSNSFGVFQIYRLAEFISIFWVTAHIPLTPKRIELLRRIVEAVLIFVCTGILLTYFSILPLETLTAHLPQSPDVAGPWSRYINPESVVKSSIGNGWGTIGYNHAYVAAQVVMLIGLKIHLSLNRKLFLDSMLLSMSILACILSESRAGLVTILIFAVVFWFQKLVYGIIATAVTVVAGVTAIVFTPELRDLTSTVGSTTKRQATLFEAIDTENLSGRDQIWIDRINFLDEEPLRWFIGSGFGSAVDYGSNAHMLYLHIILETGLAGLLMFVFLFSKILYYLHRHETGMQPIFWVTIAFLISSLTQETFYPVPAMGQFVGFYLCSLAIALRACYNDGA